MINAKSKKEKKSNLFISIDFGNSYNAEIYTASILILFTILPLIFHLQIEKWLEYTLINSSLLALLIVFNLLNSSISKSYVIESVRKIIIIPVMFYIYSQTQSYIPVINDFSADSLLIEIDRMIFGVDPTVWMHRISSPIVTEYLQITYFLFFFLPLAIGIELNIKGRFEEYKDFSGLIIFAFYLSYLLYFIFPAIGPRFHLHDFAMINSELPGIWITESLREIINSGGGIPKGVSNPQDYVNRDCMPSGHTMITIITIMMAFKYYSRLRHAILIIGISIIFSTVYLRYHYVVDLFAGALFAYLAIILERNLRRYL